MEQLTKYKAKISKILFTDKLTFACFIFSTIGIVIGPFVILIWLICIPLMIRRIKKIKNIIEKGEITKGAVIDKRYYKGWRIYYNFLVADTLYKGNIKVNAFKVPLDKGSEIDVCYNKEKPTEAFIPLLYAEKMA